MSTTTDSIELLQEPVACQVWVEKRIVYIELLDGRIVGFPASRFLRLREVTDEELKRGEN